ncbi:hypothetical protein [Globicatella sulfidifaciens]|uniref:Uncharacterized protein n=1 Tax=Globicatella sulfidifaciens TaxID=136093 RepID=A0A7X8GZA7_9LACT|nr:hypothetical protein [Globicatella sulfidifaciens]NLJ17609.1 hypothetical protein [Globicatella sulfidifaciens]
MIPFDLKTKPLFLSDFQSFLLKKPDNIYFVTFRVIFPNEKKWDIRYPFPKSDLLKLNTDLFERYLVALVNNIISTFGGLELQIYYNKSCVDQNNLFLNLDNVFQISEPIRKSYGSFINYSDRINRHYNKRDFKFSYYHSDEKISLKENEKFSIRELEVPSIKISNNTITELPNDQIWISLDVGGNSIKGVLYQNGNILSMKDYSWFPARMTEADEFNGGIETVIRFLLKEIGFENDLSKKVDAMIIGYPDIVIDNKIIGGETYKHLGIRTKYHNNYEPEYRKLYCLDELLQKYLKNDGKLIILNDGNVAALIETIERILLPDEYGKDFLTMVHTIGTEMGTGFLSSIPIVQKIPLECYQYVIDLGMQNYSNYVPSDIRSINNTNSEISGTVQKYVTQMGLFRLSITDMLENDPASFKQLITEGLIEYQGNELHVVTDPEDMRSKLTYFLTDEMLHKGNKSVRKALLQMGHALAATIDQVKTIIPEIETERVLSGGIVSDTIAYNTLKEGLHSVKPTYGISRLGDKPSKLPLVQSLPSNKRSFQIAVGELYVLNLLT